MLLASQWLRRKDWFWAEVFCVILLNVFVGLILTGTSWVLRELPWNAMGKLDALPFLRRSAHAPAALWLLPLLSGFGLLVLARTMFHDFKVVLFVLVLASFSPAIVLLLPGQGLGTMGAGNPWGILTVGIPGIGADWIARHPGVDHYTYLGMLTLPLTLWGLWYGGSVWRKWLLAALALIALFLALPSQGPIVGWLKAGTLWVLLLSAGLGFQTMGIRHNTRPWVLLIFFHFTSTGSLAFFLIRHGTSGLIVPIFSFTVAMTAFYAIALSWLIRAQGQKSVHPILWFLIFLTLIDVSTVAFWQWKSLVRLAYHAA